MALLDLLGRRWALRILWELRDETLTFRELRGACDTMSPTVLNQRLAEYYGIAGVKGHEFRKVDLTATHRRGVLGHAAVLTVFAHDLEGPAAAVEVLRGLLLGLFSFAAFFVVLSGLIERVGVAPAFAAAGAMALLVQAASLALIVRKT